MKERLVPASCLPAAIGPYEVMNILGRGGMGVVYHGRDPLSGKAVAVKTLDGARASHVAGIRREITTLASLSHKGVVRIEGHGVAAGVPWYAMELLTGNTLRDHMRAAQAAHSTTSPGARSTQTRGMPAAARGTPSVPPLVALPSQRLARPSPVWNELLVVLHAVCEALAHVHERGIVHRDLKPENIFVRGDGSPVLVDFGISARFGGSLGREELDTPGASAGTVAYMAPEQIQGEFVDARADLYALGCILYECLTGEPPFSGVAAPAVLGAHLDQRPLPPSMLVDGVPVELDRLALRLLEKEPSHRLGYADDVARALRNALPAADLPVLSPAAPYLYRPAFVGRTSSLRELQHSIHLLAQERRGGRVSLGGESGVGKTRLAMEVVREAAQLGVQVVLSRCSRLGLDETSSSHEAPLQLFAPLLMAVADRACRLGASETRRLLDVHASLLADYFPVLIDTPGYAELAGALRQEGRAQVFASLAHTLFAFAQNQPLLLVIDDLQWADELSLAFLEQLALEELTRGGVLVLGTYRMDDASEFVGRVMRAPRARHLELDRFGLGEASALVRGMLALEHSPLSLVAILQRKCSGNPFFMVEYLRSAIADGLLTRVDGRWHFRELGDVFELNDEALLVPEGIANLIQRRLRDLDPAAHELVCAGAVLGREFSVELLSVCAAVSPGEAAQALLPLRQRQIFEDGDEGNVRFVHDAIRENVYRSMPAARAAVLHRRAAEVIEPRCAADPQALRVVAHHYARAGAADKAGAYYFRAGEFAASRYANADAIACFEAGLRERSQRDEPGGGERERALLEKLGDVRAITGEHEAARAAYERALDGASAMPASGRARLYRKIGKTWETHHEHERAGASYARATWVLLAHAPGGVPIRELRASLLLGRGPAGATPSHDQRAPSQDCDSPARAAAVWWGELVQVQLERLWVCYWLNRVDDMQALTASARAIVDQHGSVFQRARFLQLLVMLHTRRERYLVSRETVSLARDACRLGENLSPAERSALDFVLFFALVLHGALDEAERQGVAVLEWANRLGAATLRVRCLTYLTLIARRRDQIEDVQRLAGECAASCAAARMGEYLGALHANLAWVAVRQGRDEEAKRLGRDALLAWRAVKVPYPMQWLARFPLLAVSVQERDLDAATEHARRLLDPEQQRLPDEIVHALMAGVDAERGGAPARLGRLASAVEAARRHTYL